MASSGNHRAPPAPVIPVDDPEDLLAIGVQRFLAPARYAVPGGAHARITHALGSRRIPEQVPRSWILPPESDGARALPGQCCACSSLALVDIESLGFLGRPLFLIGVLYARRSSPSLSTGPPVRPPVATRAGARAWAEAELVQYLARDYSEEEAMLRSFWNDAASAELWVTFNGRAFDLPFLRLRASLYRVAIREPRAHLDLLPVARRLWAAGLPDCRLQTLEQHVCGRVRTADLPGARIPDAYHDFVRTGEPWQMIEILRHNAADLVGLFELYRRALAAAGPAS